MAKEIIYRRRDGTGNIVKTNAVTLQNNEEEIVSGPDLEEIKLIASGKTDAMLIELSDWSNETELKDLVVNNEFVNIVTATLGKATGLIIDQTILGKVTINGRFTSPTGSISAGKITITFDGTGKLIDITVTDTVYTSDEAAAETARVNTELSKKADIITTYTKSEAAIEKLRVDTALAGKQTKNSTAQQAVIDANPFTDNEKADVANAKRDIPTKQNLADNEVGGPAGYILSKVADGQYKWIPDKRGINAAYVDYTSTYETMDWTNFIGNAVRITYDEGLKGTQVRGTLSGLLNWYKNDDSITVVGQEVNYTDATYPVRWAALRTGGNASASHPINHVSEELIQWGKGGVTVGSEGKNFHDPNESNPHLITKFEILEYSVPVPVTFGDGALVATQSGAAYSKSEADIIIALYRKASDQDVIDAKTLVDAKAYADAQDVIALQAAKDYTYSQSEIDTKDIAILTQAHDYTYPQADIDSKDTTTLTDAKTYTDGKFTQNSNLLVANDTTSTADAYIGNGYKGRIIIGGTDFLLLGGDNDKVVIANQSDSIELGNSAKVIRIGMSDFINPDPQDYTMHAADSQKGNASFANIVDAGNGYCGYEYVDKLMAGHSNYVEFDQDKQANDFLAISLTKVESRNYAVNFKIDTVTTLIQAWPIVQTSQYLGIIEYDKNTKRLTNVDTNTDVNLYRRKLV